MADKISLEQVARYPRPGNAGPKKLGFTPDSSRLAYLFSPEGSLQQQLWAYEMATGGRGNLLQTTDAPTPNRPLSREEELRRERSRTREVGLTQYSFASHAPTLTVLVPLAGWLYVQVGQGELTRLEGSEGAIDARLNPDGTAVAFVRDGELHVLSTAGDGPSRTLTDGAEDGLTNGLAEYIAQEEMGRSEGYWWSPNGQSLAYVQADSRHIPSYQIVHQGLDQPEIEEHRYPFAGQPNARVRLGVVGAEGGPTTWLDLGDDSDFYLARVAWRPDGGLTAQVQSRDQRDLRLLSFDLTTGAAHTLIEERGDPWLNLSHDTRFLESGEILWSSERSGFRHLYLYDAQGQQFCALTGSEWMVIDVVAVDQATRQVYFRSTAQSPLERHLYRVGLDGGQPQRLTEGAGTHECVLSPDFRWLADSWNNREHPTTVTLRRLDGVGGEAIILYEDSQTSPALLGLRPPEIISFQTPDGATLYGAVFQPEVLEPGRRYPLIVAVYGGPAAQQVRDFWDLTVDMRAQYLASEGFVVLKLDNRGSANRGLAFEAALAGKMGYIELADQIEGVRYLAQRPYVDGHRVGIYGWSYGGYMTCMALVRAGDVFKVGVAGASVTSWDGYDTHYTEHYMGHPATNPEGYAASAITTHAKGLEGKLLLIHGLVDENVHFRHTARLVAAFTQAQKPYDLLLFPEERHMPRDAKGLEYLERYLTDYFRKNL